MEVNPYVYYYLTLYQLVYVCKQNHTELHCMYLHLLTIKPCVYDCGKSSFKMNFLMGTNGICCHFVLGRWCIPEVIYDFIASTSYVIPRLVDWEGHDWCYKLETSP